jgi:hypothetical protein
MDSTSKIPGTNKETLYQAGQLGDVLGTWNFEDTKLSMWHNYYTSTCLAYVGTLKNHMTARRKVRVN